MTDRSQVVEEFDIIVDHNLARLHQSDNLLDGPSYFFEVCTFFKLAHIVVTIGFVCLKDGMHHLKPMKLANKKSFFITSTFLFASESAAVKFLGLLTHRLPRGICDLPGP